MCVCRRERKRLSSRRIRSPDDCNPYPVYDARMESQSDPLGATSAQVAGIIAAAERAAEDLRERAEARAHERIAEADRAAEHRVQAAEDEAQEILQVARAQTEAEAHARAKEIRAAAHAEAREIVSEAHAVAREVVREGTEVSRNLRELSSSLRNNSERLLRDVRLAHGSMTARLDQVAPGSGAPRRRDEPGDDLDVPEFMPRG